MTKDKLTTVRLSSNLVKLVRMEVAKRKNKGEDISIRKVIDECIEKRYE